MIKNEAIAIADQLIKAQNQAKQTKTNSGVLFCLDAKNGKYEIIQVKNLQVDDDLLEKTIKELKERQVANIERISNLEKSLYETNKNHEMFKENVLAAFKQLQSLIEEEQEQGEPL